MTNDDHTMDADESTFDVIRQLAADAKASHAASPVNDHTIDADESTLDQIKRLAEQAERGEAQVQVAHKPFAQPSGAPPGTQQAAPRPLPTRPIEPPVLEPPAERGVRRNRLDSEGHGPWQPPARSMRPGSQDRQTPDSARSWRIATVAMAVVVVVLVAWVIFGGGSGDSDQPTSTTVPAGVPVVGSTEEGGSGG